MSFQNGVPRVALRPSNREELRGIALCAGIGGLELGVHIAEPGYRTVCYVEREAYAAATLVARMADEALDNAPIWDDVASFDGRPWRGKVHLVAGGYPCQPFSFAGHRQGEDDPRHLWPQVRRIVMECDPEWCFFENVEGHVNLGANAVIADLQQMGFTVKAGLFSALEAGAAHFRRRLFILAHADKIPLLQPDRDRTLDRGNEVAGRSSPDGEPGRDREGRAPLDDDLSVGAGLRGDPDGAVQLPLFAPAPSDFATWSEILGRRPDLQPELFGLVDGVADRVDRAFAAGNGVVSLAAAHAWRSLKAAHCAG